MIAYMPGTKIKMLEMSINPKDVSTTKAADGSVTVFHQKKQVATFAANEITDLKALLEKV